MYEEAMDNFNILKTMVTDEAFLREIDRELLMCENVLNLKNNAAPYILKT